MLTAVNIAQLPEQYCGNVYLIAELGLMGYTSDSDPSDNVFATSLLINEAPCDNGRSKLTCGIFLIRKVNLYEID